MPLWFLVRHVLSSMDIAHGEFPMIVGPGDGSRILVQKLGSLFWAPNLSDVDVDDILMHYGVRRKLLAGQDSELFFTLLKCISTTFLINIYAIDELEHL